MNNIQFDEVAYKKLTAREIEIAKAASEGLGCKATAGRLFVSIETIQVHRHNLIKKLQAGNIAGAVAKLIRGGII